MRTKFIGIALATLVLAASSYADTHFMLGFDRSISAAIKNPRRALGDSAEKPQHMETVGTKGLSLQDAGRLGVFFWKLAWGKQPRLWCEPRCRRKL